MAPFTHGYSAEKQALQARLRPIEGQIRGLQRMVDEDTSCIGVLTQISATAELSDDVFEGGAAPRPETPRRATEVNEAVRITPACRRSGYDW